MGRGRQRIINYSEYKIYYIHRDGLNFNGNCTVIIGLIMTLRLINKFMKHMCNISRIKSNDEIKINFPDSNLHGTNVYEIKNDK